MSSGGILFTSGSGADAVRALRALRLEQSGVDLESAHRAAPSLGALTEALPDFYHKIVLGETVSDEEWAAMARRLDSAARLCQAAVSA